MPCMGPNKDDAYERADKAFEEIKNLLSVKYSVDEPPYFIQGYKQSETQLKDALRELFWAEACGSF